MKKPPQFILDLAKKLNTPELRALYRRQKELDSTLDQRIEKLSEEIEDVFEHLKDSLNGGKT